MLRIYWMFKSQYLKTQMEYTFNFWLMVVVGLLMRTSLLAITYVLFRNIHAIAGWAEGEAYLIIAFMYITEGLCNLLFEGIWRIPALVFRGEFDVMLTRPASPLFQILSHDLGLHGFGILLLGILSLGMALSQMGWLTWMNALLCLLFVVCGTVVRMSTHLIGASHVFWLKTGGQANITYLISKVGEYARYPISIYPTIMQFVLCFLIPFAMIGYFPALLLRGEQVLLNAVILLGVTVGYFFLARFVFYRGIRRYESAGM